MKEKINPYFQPLYDALEDMIPIAKLKEYIVSHKPVQRIVEAYEKEKTDKQ